MHMSSQTVKYSIKQEEEMIQQEFDALLNDYLNSSHRKKSRDHYESIQLCQECA